MVILPAPSGFFKKLFLNHEKELKLLQQVTNPHRGGQIAGEGQTRTLIMYLVFPITFFVF